jgi:hypothetical protein
MQFPRHVLRVFALVLALAVLAAATPGSFRGTIVDNSQRRQRLDICEGPQRHRSTRRNLASKDPLRRGCAGCESPPQARRSSHAGSRSPRHGRAGQRWRVARHAGRDFEDWRRLKAVSESRPGAIVTAVDNHKAACSLTSRITTSAGYTNRCASRQRRKPELPITYGVYGSCWHEGCVRGDFDRRTDSRICLRTCELIFRRGHRPSSVYGAEENSNPFRRRSRQEILATQL